MRYDKTSWIRNLLFSILGIFLVCGTSIHTTGIKKRYQIEDGSKLLLKGSSNVNTFTCDCQDRYTEQVLEADRTAGHAHFRNASLRLKSTNFNCHNRKIDCDMQKALKADQYPYIQVALADTWMDAKCFDGTCKDWFDVQAKVNITITKVCKEESIPARARVLGPGRFQLQGEKALQMSAYGVDPPEAMFGMIKVNDWITFHFDLIVNTGEVQ